MQYNLTEEQSTKFYNDIKNAVALIEEIQERAVIAFEGWYQDYVNNHKSIFGFKPMSIKKFGKKITLSKCIQIVEDSNGKRRIENMDGWPGYLRQRIIAKLTHNEVLDIIGEIDVVSAACIASMNYYREYHQWVDLLDKMETYMTVPYTVDGEWLDILSRIPQDMIYYELIMGNKK